MTSLTNKDMLNNMLIILNKLNITDEDDFKKEMNKAIKNAMNDKTTDGKNSSKKTKKPKVLRGLTLYQQFVKDKYLEIKEQYEPKERIKAIAKMWKTHKEAK